MARRLTSSDWEACLGSSSFRRISDSNPWQSHIQTHKIFPYQYLTKKDWENHKTAIVYSFAVLPNKNNSCCEIWIFPSFTGKDGNYKVSHVPEGILLKLLISNSGSHSNNSAIKFPRFSVPQMTQSQSPARRAGVILGVSVHRQKPLKHHTRIVGLPFWK